MPVFPLVASSSTFSVVSSSDASATSIIFLAIRSLSEPVGLSPSSFAQNRTDDFGDIRGMPTSRVFPIASRMSADRMPAIIPGAASPTRQLVCAPLDRVAEVLRLGQVAELVLGPQERGVGCSCPRLVVERPGPTEHVAAQVLDPPVERQAPLLADSGQEPGRRAE